MRPVRRGTAAGGQTNLHSIGTNFPMRCLCWERIIDPNSGTISHWESQDPCLCTTFILTRYFETFFAEQGASPVSTFY